jgi:uncharacterized protein YggT (Ycf19 family)
METQLLLVVVLKSLVELAGLFLLGQGLLYILAGPKRDNNGIYQLFCMLTRPVLRAVRAVTPRVVLDKHVPFVAVLLLAWLWGALVLLKVQICASGELQCVPPAAAAQIPVSRRILSA